MDNDVLILGVGNEYVADDGAGIAACRHVRARINDGRLAFRESTTGGLDLLAFLSQGRSAIVLDAIDDRTLSPGTVICCRLRPFSRQSPRWSLHTMSLSQVLDFGRKLQMRVPKDVWLVGVQIEDAGTFGAPLTPEVARGVRRAAETAFELLRQILPDLTMTIDEPKEQKRHDRQRAYVS